jgi:hypothetical protein
MVFSKRPGGRYRAQLTRRRGLLRQFVQIVTHRMVRDRIPIVGAIDDETVMRSLLIAVKLLPGLDLWHRGSNARYRRDGED